MITSSFSHRSCASAARLSSMTYVSFPPTMSKVGARTRGSTG
jgi:hypothetical protein